MFDHVGLTVTDRAAAERFYDLLLGTLGHERTSTSEKYTEWDDFAIGLPDDDHPVTTGLHLGFAAPSREAVDACWRALVDAGYEDAGAPGPRPQYVEDYYGAFVRDPDGHVMEAVHHGRVRRDGCIDHAWVGVADIAASKAFYEVIAPHAGFALGTDTPERASFDAPGGGTFSLVADGRPVTRGLHWAFPGSREAVQAFHAAAVEAGYTSRGEPGERAQYHEGYYAAYVLDPDGTNVEVVDHGR